MGFRGGLGQSGRYGGKNVSRICNLEHSQNWNITFVSAINEQEEQDRDGWLKWEATGSNVDRGTNYFDCPSSGSQ